MRIRSVLKHSTMAVLEGALVASLVVGLMAGTALAGKPGGGGGHNKPGGGSTGSGTLAFVMVTDANSNGLPNWGDSLTFNVTTTAASPFVRMTCSQGGAIVYTFSAGYFADYYWSKNFILSSASWSAGAASCSATLYTTDGTSNNTLATMSIAVGA